ncbi:MAG: hypothetical protein HUJ31_12780 [Pseudomonadales bacterium]|nr:hypothetical protein [Pseudomonadales bacterium]
MAENLSPPGRWTVIRDLIAFQFKLAMDGIRDVILSPVSLALGFFGLLFGGRNPGKHFYGLLRLGHRTDRWINLFGASDREHAGDTLVDQVESILKERYAQSGVVRNIKDRTDKSLYRVQRPPEPDQ